MGGTRPFLHLKLRPLHTVFHVQPEVQLDVGGPGEPAVRWGAVLRRCQKGPGGGGADCETTCGLLFTLCTSLSPRARVLAGQRRHTGAAVPVIPNYRATRRTRHAEGRGRWPSSSRSVASLAMEGMPVFGGHGVAPASASVPSAGAAAASRGGPAWRPGVLRPGRGGGTQAGQGQEGGEGTGAGRPLRKTLGLTLLGTSREGRAWRGSGLEAADGWHGQETGCVASGGALCGFARRKPLAEGDAAAGREDRCAHRTRALRKLKKTHRKHRTKQNQKTKTGMIYLVEKCKPDFRAGNQFRPVA